MIYLKSTATSLRLMADTQSNIKTILEKLVQIQQLTLSKKPKIYLREINFLCTIIAAPTLVIAGSREYKRFYTNFTIQYTIREGWNRLRQIECIPMNGIEKTKMDILADTEIIPEPMIKDHDLIREEVHELDKIAQITIRIALEATCSRKVIAHM